MAVVTFNHTIRVGTKTTRLEGSKTVAAEIEKEMLQRTKGLPRAFAYEHRELIYQKLLAGKTHGERKRVRREKWPGNPIPGMLATMAVLPFIFDSRAPLKASTLRKKKYLKQDPRPLIATGEYMRNIGVMKIVRPGAIAWEVGFRIHTHKYSGLNMAFLARIHEYGSHKFKRKPRPHWRPAAKIMSAKFFKVMRKHNQAAIAAVIRKRKAR